MAQFDGERARQADILRYWRAVEYFSPPQVDRVDPRNGVVAVDVERPLPWEPEARLGRPKPNCVWRHTVYAGVFDISAMRDVLLKEFRSPETEHDFDGRVSGQSALLSFSVNETGRLIKDSATLSGCGWAVGRTLSPGPGSDRWLSGFQADSISVLSTLLELGDSRIAVDRNPASGHGAGGEGASPKLGTIAGVTARLVTSAASGGIGALAASVGTSLGPIAGPMAAKAIEQVGDELVTAAVDKVVDGLGGRPQTAAAAATAADSGTDENADADSAPPADAPRAIGSKVLDVYDLAAITRWVAEELGVDDDLVPKNIRIKSYQVYVKHADEAQGDEILNSFYADDLERVGDAVAGGQAGAALTQYLSSDASLDHLSRCDVRRSPATVLEHLRPDAIPLGRWPSEADQPLASSQQFAINRILAELGHRDARGVYAVNGPPGTGKTTMLRDLIAAVVVCRAERLAELPDARRAFTDTPLVWKSEDSPRRWLHPLRPELTGFEIVIASSNNGAVENVTLEVPGIKAVGESWRGEAEYLQGPASLALQAPAWGAIAARLGRRSYRSEFVERFWWGKPGRAEGQLPAMERHRDDGSGLYELLKLQDEPAAAPRETGPHDDDGDGTGEPTARPLGNLTWPEAVNRFKRARERVVGLIAERQRIHDLAAQLEGPDILLGELVDRENAARELLARTQSRRNAVAAQLDERQAAHQSRLSELEAARAAVDRAEIRVRDSLNAVQKAENILSAWDEANRPPGRLRRLFSREAGQQRQADRAPISAAVAATHEWFRIEENGRLAAQTKTRDAQRALDHARDDVGTIRAQLSRADQQLSTVLAQRANTRHQIEARRAAREAERRELAEARIRWGEAFPGAEWRAAADDRPAMESRERSAPWMDPELAQARTRLFLSALDLHRAVLANAPDRARGTLLAAMDVIKGKAPAGLPEKTVLAAWQTLFLVVPVVSTTFASVGRMFGGLGREALGWLLVDEAGQAAPQEVVGALWRSQRAVVVGDPLQLEPVVTLPRTGQARLCRHFGVASEWMPGDASVQTRADRLTRYGTWLRGTQGATWVGSPLRVHRRCDRLMFEVSNAIAYDRMMVYGAKAASAEYTIIGKNVWLDVAAPPGREKWNPVEGEYVRRTLDTIRGRISAAVAAEARDRGIEAAWAVTDDSYRKELARRFGEAVFVISPFREVAQRLNGFVAGSIPLPARRVGTVHRTQGKEADIVIFVLGTAADLVGSRDWASTTPNLVNVAITRARRRLIVIGDHAAWSRHRFFRELATHPLLTVRNAAPW